MKRAESISLCKQMGRESLAFMQVGQWCRRLRSTGLSAITRTINNVLIMLKLRGGSSSAG